MWPIRLGHDPNPGDVADRLTFARKSADAMILGIRAVSAIPLASRRISRKPEGSMIGQRGFFAVLSGALVLITPVHAAEGEFMRDAMSTIGLIEPERPAITYRERAPLVMPPSVAKKNASKKSPKGKAAEPANVDYATMPLPLPQPRQADPQWPKDPEISQRERANLDANKPIVRGAQGRMDDNNMTLSAAEMAGGRRAGAGLSDAPAPQPGEARDKSWFDPLALFGGKKSDEPSVIEPDRDGLTDPPTGYRKTPLKIAKPKELPTRNSISGNEEADPRAYLRSQSGR